MRSMVPCGSICAADTHGFMPNAYLSKLETPSPAGAAFQPAIEGSVASLPNSSSSQSVEGLLNTFNSISLMLPCPSALEADTMTVALAAKVPESNPVKGFQAKPGGTGEIE